MIEELRTEREQIEEAILVLERICAWTGSSSRASTHLDDRNKETRPSPGSKNKPKADVAA